MRTVLRTIAFAVALVGWGLAPLAAQPAESGRDQRYSSNELVNAGHQFFGIQHRQFSHSGLG